MKKLLQQGHYSLIETKHNTKMLVLNNVHMYAWVNVEGIGEILVLASHNPNVESILALGRYRLYEVKDEPKLVDLQHLELEVGEGKWQGYLLTHGLPHKKGERFRIIPTYELVPVRSARNKAYDELMENTAILSNQVVKIS